MSGLLYGAAPGWVEWFETMAKIGAGLFAFGGLCATRPVRWLIRQLLADPVGQWLDHRITVGVAGGLESVKGDLSAMRSQLETVRGEVTTNSGTSLKDEVTALRSQVAEVHTIVKPGGGYVARLLALVDRAERGVLLPGEADLLRDGIRALATLAATDGPVRPSEPPGPPEGHART